MIWSRHVECKLASQDSLRHSTYVENHALWTLTRRKSCIKTPPTKKKNHYNIHFSTMGLYFFLLDHLFCLSHCKTHWSMSTNCVGLKTCLLGTSIYMVTMTFFLGVSRSGLGTSSTTNYFSYKALGWLHGPWCKQPLSGPRLGVHLFEMSSLLTLLLRLTQLY